MSGSTDFIIKMNNNEEAIKVAARMREVASCRTPETPNEMNNFIAGIVIEENIVKVEDNYSLRSCTFCEMIPQIMMVITRCNFRGISMEAYYCSYNCGYEAEFKGRISKKGKLRMRFREHE